jgi:hypothetical protein
MKEIKIKDRTTEGKPNLKPATKLVSEKQTLKPSPRNPTKVDRYEDRLKRKLSRVTRAYNASHFTMGALSIIPFFRAKHQKVKGWMRDRRGKFVRPNDR